MFGGKQTTTSYPQNQLNQSQQHQTITLEAFEANLRGTTLLWYLEPKTVPQYPPGFIDQVVTDAAPFAKKVLILSPQTPIGWKLVDDFDVIFKPQNNTDWSILLTYLTNCAKPSIAILAPYTYPPVAFLQKINSAITLVSLVYLNDFNLSNPSSPTTAQQPHNNTTPIHPTAYQSILLPPLTLDIISTISFPQVLGISHPVWNVHSVLRDLHGAGASLVASSIGDKLGQRQFYWYYTSKNQYTAWNIQQIQNCLSALA
jgi:hypothetical protein